MANDCVNPNIDSESIGNTGVTEIEWREVITPCSLFYDCEICLALGLLLDGVRLWFIYAM